MFTLIVIRNVMVPLFPTATRRITAVLQWMVW